MNIKKTKIYSISLIIIALFVLSSCATIPDNSSYVTSYEDENLSAKIIASNNFVNLKIENKTNSVVTLLVEGSTTTMNNGETSKLVPEGTRFIQSNDIQSPLLIAPKSNLNKSFFAASAVNWDNSEWEIKSWVNPNSFSLIFPYTIDESKNYIMVQTSLLETEEVIGSIEVSKNYWHILFTSNDDYKEELYQMALKEAINKYGDNIKLVNGTYEGIWSPLSMVLYFDVLGYVDNIKFKTDVQKILN